ncbi:MAG: phosphotransferase [Micrococcales bacterium]|nr:phosphotransferase [Micrococcales bacterium]
MQPRILGALLDVPPPALDVSLAERLAGELFGVQGVATELGGERDRNFRVTEPDGTSWVLKVVHSHEPPEFTELQSIVLEHVRARAPSLPVARVRMPLGQEGPTARWADPSTGGEPLRVRMYSYLPGVPMARSVPSPRLARNVGAFVAKLDRALADLDHPGHVQDLAWDAHRVERVEPVVDVLPPAEQDLVRGALEHFRSHAGPQIPGLRRQVIHNDANLDNVLTVAVDDPRVSGVIDFGDLLRAPLVQDVATTAAYQMRDGGHPMAGPADVLVGYHRQIPLRPEEIEVLVDLIAARWVLTMTITAWQARQRPGNREYILRNAAAAREGLRRLQSLGCGQATAFLCDAIGKDT